MHKIEGLEYFIFEVANLCYVERRYSWCDYMPMFTYMYDLHEGPNGMVTMSCSDMLTSMDESKLSQLTCVKNLLRC